MSAEKSASDAIVVGGGIIGCTLAYELQRRGMNTLLLDQGPIAREASWASAGILGPPTAASLPPHRGELAALSHSRYDNLFAAVSEDSGLETTYLRTGKILVAWTEQEVETAQAHINWQHTHGFQSSWLEPNEVREMEPLVPDGILGAYHTPDAGAVTLHRFTETIAAAFRNRGGRIKEYTPATEVLTDGARVTGVDTPDGPYPAGTVVLAAGAWTRFLGPGLGRTFPTIPVKGQMISVAPGPDMPRPQRVVGNINGGYLVPRIDGTVAIGASLEYKGFDSRATPAGFTHALGLINKLGPALAEASFVTGWAGVRPGTSDDAPIMGPVEGYDGLWISTGHFRNGAQLAPGSAELVANAITEGKASPLLDHFSLSRFD